MYNKRYCPVPFLHLSYGKLNPSALNYVNFPSSRYSLVKVASRRLGPRRPRSRIVVPGPGNTEISRGACQGRGEEEGPEGKRDARGGEGCSQPCVAAFIRQFVPRRPYRMLIKRVSTVSKYLTAARQRGEATGGPIGAERVLGHGIVFGEPWSLMYASGLARWSRGTVWVVHVLLPRHSPMLRALLCALYTLSLFLSPSVSPCLSFSPYSPFLSSSHISSYFALSLPSFRSPSFPFI